MNRIDFEKETNEERVLVFEELKRAAKLYNLETKNNYGILDIIIEGETYCFFFERGMMNAKGYLFVSNSKKDGLLDKKWMRKLINATGIRWKEIEEKEYPDEIMTWQRIL